MQNLVINAARVGLACNDLAIRAGKREVVAPFSWHHHPGGIAWLVGSNGSGKSSLLRAFAGWRKPSAGQVMWHGLENDRVYYCTPAMSAPPELRVSNLTALVDRAGDDNVTALDALYPESVELDARFRSLSTGEAKRLLLWSIFRQPVAPLVLDEPYEHLSRDAKEALTALLRERALATVVIVATNQEAPSEANDRMLTLDRSVIEVSNAS